MIKPKDIIKVVSDFYDIGVEKLLSESRLQQVAHARHICMYLMREELGITNTYIGEILNRDQSTVSYSFNKIEKQVQEDYVVERDVVTLKKILALKKILR